MGEVKKAPLEKIKGFDCDFAFYIVLEDVLLLKKKQTYQVGAMVLKSYFL